MELTTVADLIEFLKTLPPEAEVGISADYDDIAHLTEDHISIVDQENFKAILFHRY